MNERLKIIRKHFGKTQKDFGTELGVSRDTYASYESGRVIPNNTFVQLLCSTFNVNEAWLRDGTGEMFVQTPKTLIDDLKTQYSLDNMDVAILEGYLSLNENERNAVKKYIMNIANAAADGRAATRESKIAERIAAADKKIAEEVNVQK